ncbi:MAG: hypothetical protein ACRDZ7_19610 [Acidimicrobiia bacterium]
MQSSLDLVDVAEQDAAVAVVAVGVPLPAGWTVLARAMEERRPVRARYHGRLRLLCPHALGWSGPRAKVLAYQSGGQTGTGALPADSRRRWRSMFVEELEGPQIWEGAWQSADNWLGTPVPAGMDRVELWVRGERRGGRQRDRG